MRKYERFRIVKLCMTIWIDDGETRLYQSISARRGNFQESISNYVKKIIKT